MTKRKGESEDGGRIGNDLPIPASEIGSRISEIAKRVGGKKALAEKAHISESHLYRYISGQNEPSVSRLVALAEAAGVSIAWLATGQSPAERGVEPGLSGFDKQLARPVDLDLLERIISEVRYQLDASGLELPPAAEARVYRLLYQLHMEGDRQLDQRAVADVIQLAAYR